MTNFLFDINTIKRVHLIGIGGAGMGGIAEILLNKGYQVSGSDVNENAMTQHLRALGAKIALGHRVEQISDAQAVVFSSIISEDNAELNAARNVGLPILHRAQMLAELMKSQRGIAISGTHGKTTTTGLVCAILLEAGLDPTFAIGGVLLDAATSARVGKGNYFVIEADESDASFLHFRPEIAIVTNIDEDHLNNYDNFAHLQHAFLQFLTPIPANGLAIICSDDPVLINLLPKINAPVWTYGFKATDHIYCVDFRQQGTRCHLQVKRTGFNKLLEITLNLPGRHNVLNALAAIAVATYCQVPDHAIQAALAKFAGTGRRFQCYGEFQIANKNILLLDDYGHHPKEIAVTLQAMRQAWPERRLVLIFQPHRFSRTAALFEEFATVLSEVDVLLLLDIYSANEPTLPDISGQRLYQAISEKRKNLAYFVENVADLPSVLSQVLQNNDVVMLQGAGDIGKLAPQFASQWQPMTPQNSAINDIQVQS